MSINYTIVGVDGREGVTAFIDGEIYQAANDHERYLEIKDALAAGDAEGVVSLFSRAKDVVKRFQRLTERVTFNGGVLYFDNDPVNGTVADHILRVQDEGGDFMPLVNFLEKVQTNPNEHSREMLYGWLKSTGGFTITADGDIVGYKGVQTKVNDKGDSCFTSVSTGTALVDGEVVTGHIPNPLGSVIEMPRSEVQHDPRVGCHTGLHVGTWGYASTFASTTIEVRVNPRDVVSVPTDASEQKMRVCRYVVVGPVTSPYKEAVLTEKVAVVPDAEIEDSFDAEGESSWIGVVNYFDDCDYDEDDEVYAVGKGNLEVYNQDEDLVDDLYDVPWETFVAFRDSESKGAFYNQNIKGKF